MALCQGPLYHLLEQNERRAVLSACAAALKPGGSIPAAFMLQYAHLRDLAQRDLMRLVREYDSFYKDYLADGIYSRNQLICSYHSDPEKVRCRSTLGVSKQQTVDRMFYSRPRQMPIVQIVYNEPFYTRISANQVVPLIAAT